MGTEPEVFRSFRRQQLLERGTLADAVLQRP